MHDTIIELENVSKLYRLGNYGSGSFKEDFTGWWNRKVLRKPADLLQTRQQYELWALKNINLSVNRGEVLGFLGSNGAGKSTLLKLIARITLPTTGIIRGKGRIATLLEVGTGFHHELTGRENIFLNGTILGMKTREIKAKLDEIIAFSGIERFIDTPVKRYSSGMYVRLAFAIAANLDPEILIIDEVLAVGDEAFQRKCIGKMKEVTGHAGRTVLFVSHNTQALKNLCARVVCMDKGQIVEEGLPEKVIADYLKKAQQQFFYQEYATPEEAPGNDHIRIKKVSLVPRFLPGFNAIDIRTPLEIHFEFWYFNGASDSLIAGIQLHTLSGECIFDICSTGHCFSNGKVSGHCLIPGNFLNDGSYYISLSFVKNTTNRLFHFEACLSFDVEDYRTQSAWFGKWLGYVRPAFPVLLEYEPILTGIV
ncbi:ABC transporter ATP-binding protein [Deminuibacter soli]|uniref:ABC transporter ATP-binding protein n=1 Tax=Deminuibacter soli TaxID=2291815 RepID=A0A3E1NMF5_9BACT|nr:ABC transporter ATP-binding protein [Deminuibacter soli]RFM29091.1 ABC transporter ATP-binding protein [Deminuibacter soli]